MTVVTGAALAMLVLAAAGCLPVLALAGFRWIAVPLAPLAGALVAAVAATCCVGIGATTMTWFVILSVLAAAATVAWWATRPDRRPWTEPRPPVPPGYRATGVVAAVAIAGAIAWCLRSLSTPTVGFDTRAIWLMRAGWFLQPHHQVVVDMSAPGIFLPQTSYPPLVSAAGAVAWSVSGSHTMRLGVVVIALLNACALAVAAFALVECGHRAGARLWPPGAVSPTAALFLPPVVGVATAVALVFVTFGVAEPFMTNGYADPLWSIAAVGAVAFGLLLDSDRSSLGVAAVLVLVAGLSKQEGAATAALLIVLVAGRRAIATRHEPGRLWWRPLVAGLGGLAVIGSWPAIVRLRHLRPVTSGGAPAGAYIHRAHQAITGLAPYLHVLLLAAPLALVGALVLTPVRRRAGIGNDAWGWAGLLAGSAVILGAYVTGTAAVPAWLTTTAHRVTEFTSLAAWWLIAFWAVAASAAPAAAAAPLRSVGARRGTAAARAGAAPSAAG